jgi:hypothetical protein
VNALRLLLLATLAVSPLAAAQAPAGQAGAGAECSQTSTGLVPLTDLGKRKYRGHPGGLYPGGANQPSRPYLRQGLAAAKRVRPINGRIVLLSIGMSNASNEFRSFIKLASIDPGLNPAVKLVDGAMGNWDARRVARPGAGYWAALDRRLVAEGTRRELVARVGERDRIELAASGDLARLAEAAARPFAAVRTARLIASLGRASISAPLTEMSA